MRHTAWLALFVCLYGLCRKFYVMHRKSREVGLTQL